MPTCVSNSSVRVRAFEPRLHAEADRGGPALRGILDGMQQRRTTALALDAREIVDVATLDAIANATARH